MQFAISNWQLEISNCQLPIANLQLAIGNWQLANTSTPTTEGNFIVTVTASDDAGGEVEDEFNIEVSKSEVSKSGNLTVTVTESWNHFDSKDQFKMEVRLTPL
ncbi:MAG: hypothetical protein GDA43_26185 [Hormoscilla sp. SP5CHS1]|nr:hypothetical protein [Hormoscilla sp. SP5CHS1]